MDLPRNDSEKISTVKIAEYRKTFDYFDQNKDGLITQEELVKVMNAFFRYPTEEQAQQMIRHHDKHGKGGIDFESFLEIFSEARDKGKGNIERIQQQFRSYDIDGDGYISATDMHMSFLNLGKDLTIQEVEEIIKMADVDGDGRISFEEFYKIMAL